MGIQTKRRLKIVGIVMLVWALLAFLIDGWRSLTEAVRWLSVVLFGQTIVWGGLLGAFFGAIFCLKLLGSAYQRKRELAFREGMIRQNRFLSWDAFADERRPGNGTLIVQLSVFKATFLRIWWTGDNLLDQTSAVATVDGIFLFDPFGKHSKANSPEYQFAEWCIDQYLNEEAGKAKLIDLVQDIQIETLNMHEVANHFKKEFPALGVFVLRDF